MKLAECIMRRREGPGGEKHQYLNQSRQPRIIVTLAGDLDAGTGRLQVVAMRTEDTAEKVLDQLYSVDDLEDFLSRETNIPHTHLLDPDAWVYADK